MEFRSTEELTIRSNGTNRKASLTNRNLLPICTIGEGVLTIRIRLRILDMSDGPQVISLIL